MFIALKKNANKHIALKITWLAFSLSAILLLYRVTLHSDSLFLDDLATDLFKHGGNWNDWKLTPAPAYLPDMVLYFIGYALIPSVAARILFVSFCQAIMLGIVCIWLCRLIRPTFSEFGQCLILFTLVYITATAANSSMWLFFNSTNNHFATLLFGLLSLGLVLKYLESPSKLAASMLVATAALAKASTAVFLISFFIPAILTLLFVFFTTLKISGGTPPLRNRLLIVGFLLCCSMILATALERTLIHHNALFGRTSVSMESLVRSLNFVVSAFQISFSPDNKWTMVLSIAVVIAALFLFAKLLNSINLKINCKDCKVNFNLNLVSVDAKFLAAGLFLSIGAPLNFFGAVLSGGFADPWGFRYFLLPFCLVFLVAILVLDETISDNIRHNKKTNLLIAVFSLALILAAGLSAGYKNNSSPLKLLSEGVPKHPEESVANCLNALRASGIKINSGIADFWMSRGIRYRTNTDEMILPVTKDAKPFFHMATLGPLRYPQRYNMGIYNFAILGNSGHGGPFDFTEDTIGKLLPKKHNVYNCQNSDMQIWVYSDSSLDTMMRDITENFLFSIGEGGSYSKNASELPGNIGVIANTSRVANSVSDKAGFLTFGPYIHLPAGNYQLNIVYKTEGVSEVAAGVWDIGRFNNPSLNRTILKGDLLAVQNGHIQSKFTVEKGGIDEFEVRNWFNGKGSMTIDRIEIRMLGKSL